MNIRIVRIFNTYGPRMHPFDGRVVSNFIRQALRGEDITIFGDGSQTRSFCYRDDLVEGMIRMMNGPDDFIGPGEPRQPGRVHDPASWPKLVIELTGSQVEARPQAAAGRRPDAAPARHHAGQAEARLGADRCRSAKGWQKTIEWFRTIDMGRLPRRRRRIIERSRSGVYASTLRGRTYGEAVG